MDEALRYIDDYLSSNELYYFKSGLRAYTWGFVSGCSSLLTTEDACNSI